MKPLTTTELLAVWEMGLNRPILEKSLQLLAAAFPSSGIDKLAKMSIGDRDSGLFRLRAWMFGSDFVNNARCPKCSEQVEWKMDLTDFPLSRLPGDEIEKAFHFEKDGYSIRFRLPTSEDIIKETFKKNRSTPQKILRACILEIKKDQKDYRSRDLPAELLEAIGREMDKEDPMANITVILNCPACAHQWEVLFDILSYLWAEIDNWAKHILQEVYMLARAFSWSERDILNMSPRRRQIYLEMIGA